MRLASPQVRGGPHPYAKHARTPSASASHSALLNTSSVMTPAAAAAATAPAGNEQNIRVAARIRPKTPKEVNHPTAVQVNENLAPGQKWPSEMIVISSNAIVHNGKQKFRFDSVFPEHANQESVFEEMCAPLVRAVCSGYNAALFAYGQTGTGKTHTMLGEDIWMLASSSNKELSTKQRDVLEHSEMRGVIPRAMKLLFQLLRTKQHKVSVSYLEIYNEKIFDLLNPESRDGLDIREDKQTGLVQAVDCVLRRVSSEHDVLDALWKGAKNRAVCSTDMNEHSSRSHTIFQVFVETRGVPGGEPGTKAKLNLVDLAGSEKWRPHQLSEFSDQRIAEMTSINQSLSNLGNCVRALLRSDSHIPFRNSKLTRLLQDSLGGNSQCGFVVTVSPSELAHEETISTLQFADRAKRVVVRVEQNQIETPEGVMRKLQQELTKAREENKELKTQLEQQLLLSASMSKNRKGIKKDMSSWSSAEEEDEDEMENVVQNAAKQEAVVNNNINNKPAAKIGQLLQRCLELTPPSNLVATNGGGQDDVLAKPEAFLKSYHEHLRQRKPDELQPGERFALVEWSLSLQAGELDLVKSKLSKLKEELELKEEQISVLNKQLGEAKQQLQGRDKQMRQREAEFLVEKEQWARAAAVPVAVATPAAPPRQASPASVAPSAPPPPPPSQYATTQQRGPNSNKPTTNSSEVLSTATTSALRQANHEAPASAYNPSLTRGQIEMMASARELPSSSMSRGLLTKPHQQQMTMMSPGSVMVTRRPSADYVVVQPSPSVNKGPGGLRFNSSRASSSPLVKTSTVNPSPLVKPSGRVWDRFVDDSTGRAYYHCKETGQTTWRRPSEVGVIVRGE